MNTPLALKPEERPADRQDTRARPSLLGRKGVWAWWLCGLMAAPALQAAPGTNARTTTPATTPATTQACPPLLDHRFERLQDEKPQHLCQYAGKVVLVVNTASFCGFTGQYEGLETLYARYRDRGLVVLGFPANDFGRQEPGSNQAIAEFCENTFGVRFPMFSKTQVVGRDANPLYRELARITGERPQWNFHKYIIGRDGQTVRSHASAVDPKNPLFLRDIEKMISTK